jgi:putative metal-binding protein
MMSKAMLPPGRPTSLRGLRFAALFLLLPLLGRSPAFPTTLGANAAASFSLCESATDSGGLPRPECQGGDIRFQADGANGGSTFGWSVATGKINGDDLMDLVVGDPGRNRVYIFFGRVSAKDGWGLDPASLSDRMVSPDTQADVILSREPLFPGQVGSFGFSVAVGKQPLANACGTGFSAAAVAIGAPGHPGTTGNAPGTVFYIPAGALCRTASNPATPVTFDPGIIGQAIQSPSPAQDDEFGYSVALARLLINTGTEEDLIVGARGDLAGGGSVTAFPVTNHQVNVAPAQRVRIEGAGTDGLGEVIAVGDLDLDFDATLVPNGKEDDLAIGAVGSANGKVLMVQGPLSPTGGQNADGIYREATDIQIKKIEGEASGDYFGFSAAISAQGQLAVGAVFADNIPPAASGSTGGGDPKTNVSSGKRINGGKAYLWNSRVFTNLSANAAANTANTVLVARRSGDQLGFAVAFGDLDGTGKDDFIVTARREDGPALNVNQIDRGTAYVVLDQTALTSPVDLNKCAVNSDCTGVSGIDTMLFGADRVGDQGDEVGYAIAAGDFNGDKSDDLFLSSITHQRVYAATIQDTDDDRLTKGRNIRDDDDDNDNDPDLTDCAPLDAQIHTGATEVLCNKVDENCNGMADDAPDHDGDGYDACAPGTDPGDKDGKAKDCDDNDPNSHPTAPELCDGNNNACTGAVPTNERDLDGDGYVQCTGWVDTQGDNPTIKGGGDCDDRDSNTFPGAAPKNSITACMKDSDGDDFGDAAPPSGVTPGTDCDDRTTLGAATFPGSAEKESTTACMKDTDGDGYGDSLVSLPIIRGSDCNDQDSKSYPGAPELCDGNDNACAGTIPANETDPDGDKYVQCTPWADIQGDNPDILGGGDCDTADGKTFPGAGRNEVFNTACMRDKDGDGFGESNPPAGITPGTDCDDVSPSAAVTFPGAAQIEGPLNCMKDADNDGYGDASVALPVAAGTDCDDTKATVHPGIGANPPAAEVPDDGIDQDCNGFDQVTCYADQDHDGYGAGPAILNNFGACTTPSQSRFNTDCDDANPAINPGAVDIPDDPIDQDCNGHPAITCYKDEDKDGHGNNAGVTVVAQDGTCDAAQQESATRDDCNDQDPNTYPGAVEKCDGNDNTCSGIIPFNETDPDGDHFVACSGWADTQGDNPTIQGGGDCDPADKDTFPGAAPKEVFASACMRDKDGDDYGDLNPPAGVTRGTDCDDSSPAAAFTYPGAAELEVGGATVCMKDQDNDGYGDSSVSLPVVKGKDCDDANASIYPGAAELCDGRNTSCSGSLSVAETDPDGDGYVACSPWVGTIPGILGGGDCDPNDKDTFPGAAPKESVPTACMRDKDGDDFGDLTPPAGVTPGTDCDDTSPAAAFTYPGAAELEVGGSLVCMRDRDNDGWGDSSALLPVVAGLDCADTDPTRYPGAPETCGDGVDSNCDGQDPVCPIMSTGTAVTPPLSWTNKTKSNRWGNKKPGRNR